MKWMIEPMNGMNESTESTNGMIQPMNGMTESTNGMIEPMYGIYWSPEWIEWLEQWLEK